MSGDWKDAKEVLEFVVLVVGIPVGLIQYWRAVSKEQRSREDAAYSALDDKFIEFQKLCFDNPHLDIYHGSTVAPTAEQQLKKTDQEQFAFTMLFSIFERAFLLHESGSIRTEQWIGWHQYIVNFFQTQKCREAWTELGETYDRRFDAYMQRRMAGAPEPERPGWLCNLFQNL